MRLASVSVVVLALLGCSGGPPAASDDPVAPEPSAPSSPVAPAAPSGPELGALKDLEPIMGCGCSVAPAAQSEELWLGVLVGEDDLYAGIDGKDRRLKRQGAEPAGPREAGPPETFVGDGYTLSIAWSSPRPCAPDDEGCEWVGYDAAVTVSREGGGSKVFRGSGGCGC